MISPKEVPNMGSSELLEEQYKTHQHINGYLCAGGRDPILFELADMLLVNAELLTRIVRATEER